MSFASLIFIIFFAIVLLVVLVLERFKLKRAKELFLLLASYFFYGWWDWRFCFLLLFVTVVSYFTAKYSSKKAIFVIGIIVPLAVLGVFKYFNFFLSSFSALIGREIGALSIILPVGISFYTFQALSYVIDVKREKIPVERDFIKLALYISFFPQLVAGPIVRAADFLPQLREEERRITLKNFALGIQIFAFGLFKKIVLADHLSVFVDDVFRAPAAFNWWTVILAVLSYAMQIYLDFSGYSDMATGCAKCLGYDFKPNFNLPYIARNVTEFWRRWHISLSNWLKEYLYIPLGGNRKGKFRQYFNLFIVMVLGGLWHGANWTFIFWGALNGLALVFDKLLPKNKDKKPVISALSTIATFAFICFTWIFFRAENFANAWAVIKAIFTLQQGVSQPYIWSFVTFILVIGCTIAAAVKSRKEGEMSINGSYPVVSLNKISGLTVFFVFLGLILIFAFTGEQPFVYFQF